MRKVVVFFVILFVISSLTLVFAGIWIGGGLSQEFGGLGRTFLDGRLTFGSFISFDLANQMQLSDINFQYWDQIYAYINMDIHLWLIEVYAGFSPTLYFYLGQFQFPDFMNHGYLHGGLSIDFAPLRIYGEAAYRLYYDPISIGNVPIYSIGLQVGF